MKQGTAYIILVVFALIALLIGGYLAFGQKLFSKRQMENVQSINSIQQSSEAVQNEPEIEQTKVVQNDQSVLPPEKTNIVDNGKKQEAMPAEKITEPAKPAETKTDTGKIVDRFVSFGFQKSSSRTIKAIIVHTSYNNLGGDVFDFAKVMQEWKSAGVSPHYAIDRDGTIYHLVADQNIAWHAGVSKLPDGTTDVNGSSIGVEVINSQSAKFTDQQYTALNYLIAILKKKDEIKYILGHDEIAPGRKSDPWGIDWKKVNR
jgi:hypothetical protein